MEKETTEKKDNGLLEAGTKRKLIIAIGVLLALMAVGIWLLASVWEYRYVPDALKWKFRWGLILIAVPPVLAALLGMVLYVEAGNRDKRLPEEERKEKEAKKDARNQRLLKALTVLAPASVLVAVWLLHGSAMIWFLLLAAASALFAYNKYINHGGIFSVLLLSAFFAAFFIGDAVGIGKLIHYRGFNSIDLEAANPAAGEGVVCYDLDREEYTGRYTPEGRGAKNAADAGYVVLYTTGTKAQSYQYSSTTNRNNSKKVSVRLDTAKLSVYDVKQGKIIAEKEFTSRPPASVSENTRTTSVGLDNWNLADWVKQQLPKND